MEQEKLHECIEQFKLVALQAGAAAKRLQGKVANEGKELPENYEKEYGTVYSQAVVTAKTVVDEFIQDQILLTAHHLFKDTDIKLTIDAEENTETKKLFPHTDSDLSLIIDPIDGTLPYLEGDDYYSVCILLIEKGVILTAIHYFPARGVMYYLDERNIARVSTIDTSYRVAHDTEIVLAETISKKVIYADVDRAPDGIIDELSAASYSVLADNTDGMSCPDSFLTYMKGDALAKIEFGHQIRDILPGPILAAAPGGYAKDFQGNDYIWPQKGRLSNVVFGAGELPEDVWAILKKYADTRYEG